MLGITNSEKFKTQILAERERVIKEKHSYSNVNTQNYIPGNITLDSQLLIDIKNELVEIKNALKK
jgi:hypothetical protein